MPFSFARDDTNLDGTLFVDGERYHFLIKVRDLSVGPHFPSVAVQDKGWHCMRIWRFDPNKPPVVADITKLKGCLTKRKPHAVKGIHLACSSSSSTLQDDRPDLWCFESCHSTLYLIK